MSAMRKSKRVPILTKYPRHPDAEYRVRPATSPGYTYVRMFRTGRRSPTSPTIYANDHLPRWMIEGMQLIDLAYDAGTQTAHIEGFGGKSKDEHVFYKQTKIVD